MTDILAALRQDHRNLSQLLEAMERQLDRFDHGESPDYDIMQGVLDYCQTYPDIYHHPKEDLVFEHLRRVDPAAAEAVGDLHAEHRSLAEVTSRFAAALHSVLQDLEVPRDSFDHATREFLERYRHHIIMEESVFFPAAEARLTAADWAAIEAEAKTQSDPLFSAEGEAKYTALRADILAWASEDG
ncbi:MAG: hemerythrin domain-containing protein [Alphaproteobacteria bacterium]